MNNAETSRRQFLRVIGIGAAGLAVPQLLAGKQSSAARKPNFIIFFTDDQGYNDVGCFGSPNIRTPNFDRMAREGMKLTSFYAQPVCGPSRAALMTGCYPIRVGEPQNRKNQHNVLHPKEITIAEVLKKAGYATAIVGKWHLAGGRSGKYDPQLMPNAQGFDYHYGTPLHNGYTRAVSAKSFKTQIVRNSKVLVDALDQEGMNNLTADYTKEAIKFITTNKDKPFFLYLAHNMPHVPLGASAAFRGKSKRGLYGDVIEELDWSAGQVLKTLKDLDIDKDTLVIFTSDNGPWIEKHLGDHGGSADPLRGWKMSAWEGGPRVPCIVRWPGKTPAGKVCDEIVTTMDLMPTFAKLGGGQAPNDRIIDGKDVTDLLTGKNGAISPHEAFYTYNYLRLTSVRSGKWKLALQRPARPPGTGWSGRKIDAVGETQLFDLEKDIGEKHDVAAKNPEIVARMMKLVEKARQDLGDYNRVGKGARFFEPNPPTTRGGSGAKRKPRATKANTKIVYKHPEPVGDLRFDFESGLQGWKVVEGELETPVVDLVSPYRTGEKLNKQGKFFLSTLGGSAKNAADANIATIQSPVFELTGAKMSFLVGGGRGDRTRVDLCDAKTGETLMTAGGPNAKHMHRINWNLGKIKGKHLFIRVADASKGGFGHVLFDDFSAEAQLVAD